MQKGQTLESLFRERQSLYRQYADIIFDCTHMDQEQAAAMIAAAVSISG